MSLTAGKLGQFQGQLHLEVDSAVRPVQLPVRKVPIAIKEKGKEELKRVTSLGVIEPVEGPIEWVSSLVVVKKSG